MKITFKLFAGLSEYLPPGTMRNAMELDVPEECSLNDLVDDRGIPRDQIHLVLVNGFSKNEDERNVPILADGDTVAIWPLVAGG